MVAKNDIMSAAHNVDGALKEFVHDRGEAKVLVWVNRLGHLHAVVATHGFEGIPEDERVERIREFLRKKVTAGELPAGDLAYLYRIEALTAGEYDARLLQSAESSETLDLFLKGSKRNENGDD